LYPSDMQPAKAYRQAKSPVVSKGWRIRPMLTRDF
jgi:hypothetical protein